MRYREANRPLPVHCLIRYIYLKDGYKVMVFVCMVKIQEFTYRCAVFIGAPSSFLLRRASSRLNGAIYSSSAVAVHSPSFFMWDLAYACSGRLVIIFTLR